MGKTLEDKAEPLTSNSELLHCGGLSGFTCPLRLMCKCITYSVVSLLHWWGISRFVQRWRCLHPLGKRWSLNGWLHMEVLWVTFCELSMQQISIELNTGGRLWCGMCAYSVIQSNIKHSHLFQPSCYWRWFSSCAVVWVHRCKSSGVDLDTKMLTVFVPPPPYIIIQEHDRTPTHVSSG